MSASGSLTTKLDNSKNAKILVPFYFNILDIISENYNIDRLELAAFLDGKSIEDRMKQLKKLRKRDKKDNEKFQADGLDKPKSPMELYRLEYRKNCQENNIEYKNDSFRDSWRNLPESEKSKFIKENEKLKSKYEKEFERQKKDAINRGEFLPDEPKRPLNAYMIFKGDCSSNIKKFLTKTEQKIYSSLANKDRIKFISGKWKDMCENDTEKRLSYELLSLKDKHRYELESYERHIFIIKRQIDKALREDSTNTNSVSELNEKLEHLQANPPIDFSESSALEEIRVKLDKEKGTSAKSAKESNTTESSSKTKSKTTTKRSTKKKKEPEPEPEPESDNNESESDSGSDSDEE
jgi:hypothetical protein